jgi:Sugar (and other) transporter
MIQNITYRSYIVFAVFNFASIVFVYFTFPETAGRPLESVDFLFSDRNGKRPSIWRVVKDSTNAEFNAEYELRRAEERIAQSLRLGDLEEKETKEIQKQVEVTD